MSEDLPGVNIPVEATISVDSSGVATDLSSLTKEFSKSGRESAKGFSKSFDSSLTDLKKTFKATFAGLEGNQIPGVDARVKVLNDLADEVRRTAQEYARSQADIAEASSRTASGVVNDARKVADAARDVGAAQRQAAEDARRASSSAYGRKFGGTASATTTAASDIAGAAAAGNKFEQMLARLLAQAAKLPPSFDEIMRAIVADLSLASKEISETIVKSQGKMQADGILKQQAKDLAQAKRDANRVLLQEQRAADREQEQVRQATLRTELADHRAQNSQVNSIINAGLQEELIQEKGHQQRRTALIRAGLDATRSLYQSTSSGLSSVFRGVYNSLTSITRSGEDQITETQRRGLLRRNAQSETLMKQQTAMARQQMTVYQKTQEDLNAGVVGAIAGTSAAGASLRNLALAGGAGGIISAIGLKQAIDFESSFADVTKTVDGTTEQLAELRTGIIELSKVVPSTTTEIAAVAAAAGQLGIATPDILDFTRVMIDLGNSTNVSAESAADLLAQFANVTRMDPADYSRLGATIVALGNSFASTEADIIAMAQRISSAGAIAGIPEQDIIAISTALTSVGINAEAGGTSFSTAIAKIAKAAAGGAEDIAPFAEAAQMSSEAFLELFKQDPSQAIAAFVKGLATIKDTGGNLFQALDDIGFKEIRISNSFRSLAASGDLFQRALAIGNVAWEENTALVNESTVRYQTAASQLKIFRNRVTDVARTFGNALLPVLVDGLTALTPLLELAQDVVAKIAAGFETLANSPHLEVVRTALFGIAAGLGAVLAGKAAIEVLQLMGTVLGSLTSPLGITVLAFAALGGVFAVIYKNSGSVRELVAKLGDTLKGFARTLKEAVAPVVERVFGAIVTGVSVAGEAIQALMDLLIKGDFTGTFNRVFGVEEDSPIVAGLLTIRQGVINTFDTIIAAAETAWTTVKEVVATGVEAVQELLAKINLGPFVSRVAEIGIAVRDALVNAFGFLSSFVQAIANTIDVVGVAEGLRQAFSVVIDGILSLFGGIGNSIADVFSRINWSNVASAILTGIYSVFHEVAERIAAFLLSDQFLGTVLVVLGTVAAILGSALAGIVTGLAEGISGSDLAHRIGDIVGDALEEGLKLAFASMNPVLLIKKLFTDPFGSALGVAATAVTVILGVKVVGAFVKAFSAIKSNIDGVRQSFRVFNGGIGEVAAEASKAERATRTQAAQIKVLGDRYGAFGAKAIQAADNISKMRDKVVGLVTPVQLTKVEVEETTKRIREGFGTSAYTPVQNFTNRISDMNQKFQLTNQLVGGLAAGTGLGAFFGSDNSAVKIAGITSALSGLAGQAVTTFQTLQANGIGAAIVSGGIGLAITGVATLVSYLIASSQRSKKAKEELAATNKEYASAFKEIIEAGSGSNTARALEFFSRLNDTSDDSFTKFRTAVDEFGFDQKRAASALVGTTSSYEKWRKQVTGALSSVSDTIAANRKKIQELPDPGFGDSGVSPQQAALVEQNRILGERKKILEDSLTTIDGVRTAYEETLASTDRELLIRKELRKLEDDRKSSIEKNLEKRRDEKGLLDDIKQQLLDITEIEAGGANVGEAAARNAREALRGLAEAFTSETDGIKVFDSNAITEGLDLSNTSATADKVRSAFDGIRDAVSGVVAELANSSQGTEDFNNRLALVRESYIQILKQSGVTAEGQAEAIVDSILSPFQNTDPAKLAFFARVSEDLKGLQAQIERDGLDRLGFVANLDDKPLQEAVNAFLKQPDTKNIEAILGLGVPQNQLEEFIKNPSEKTLGFVVTPDDQAAFDQYVAENITQQVSVPTVALPPPPTTVSDFLDHLFAGSDPRAWDGTAINVDTVVNPPPPVVPNQFWSGIFGEGTTPGYDVPLLPFVEPTAKATVDSSLTWWDQSTPSPTVTPQIDPQAQLDIQRYKDSLSEPIEIVVTFKPDGMPDLNALGAAGQQGIYKPGFGKKNSYGSVITRPTFTHLGEGFRKEVVIPLSKPNRAAELFQQSGLAEVLSRSNTMRRSTAAATKNSDPKMGDLIGEVRGLRSDIREFGGGSEQITIHHQNPAAVVDEMARRKRRQRLGIRPR